MSVITQDFYTTGELAAMLKVTTKTVYNWVLRGEAPPYEKFSGCLWFYKDKLAGFQQPIRGRRHKT
jgi:hypothetical protein